MLLAHFVKEMPDMRPSRARTSHGVWSRWCGQDRSTRDVLSVFGKRGAIRKNCLTFPCRNGTILETGMIEMRTTACCLLETRSGFLVAEA